MKKNIVLAVLLLCVCVNTWAQTRPTGDTINKPQITGDTISKRIVLIGDAGQLTNGRHPIVDAVRKLIQLDSNTTVFFLGDNLYRNGLPDVEYSKYGLSKAILDSQLSVVAGTKAYLYMIPGNHDWENGGRGGYNAMIRQQLYVSFTNTNRRAKYLPEEGCPGPEEIPIGTDITVIVFDSQWWLHPYDKPEIESDCKCKTTEELVEQIADIAAHNAKKLVILACHHPFKSNGIHGGFFTLTQHLFPLTDLKKNLYIPLPILGSIYPLSRSLFGTPQDLKYPTYQNMVSEISSRIKKAAPNLIFVSGHDHNLQLIRDSTYNYIVSGGGSKQNRTSKSKLSIYNNTIEGFAVLEVSVNKNVNLFFYTVHDSIVKSQPFFLMNFAKLDVEKIDSTKSVVVEDPFLKYKDTTTVAITPEFYQIKGLRKVFMGENYRKEWGTPVNMRVFNVNKEKGGFKLDGLGGGKQTLTLKLKDPNGKDWVLRSVNKNPGQTIPETFRGSFAKDLLNEIKSASFPYGALIVPGLTKPLGLMAPEPELFFVPDDPALGYYRELFANKVCMLEKRDPTLDGTEAHSTAKIFNDMIDDNDHRAVQQDVLRARILDMVIGDYDRHFDQWRWDTQDTGKGKIYYPIPRDRDQAFFYSGGLVMRLINRKNLPFLKGFRYNIPQPSWLAYTARDLDRIFLTEMDTKEWKTEIARVETKLTDTVIRSAVHRLPPEIFRIHGERIISKMISRRNQIDAAAMTYYRFLSRKVNVIGSNGKEFFKISNAPNGMLQVKVYAKGKGYDTSFVMYDRVFDPVVTKEIRLYGLNDKDYFEVEKDVTSRIKLRMIGGGEADTFDIKGNVETLLYDVKDSLNVIKNASHAKNRFTLDPPLNERGLLGFNYNYSKFPMLQFNYNSDDRVFMGAGFGKRTFAFRNLPYASDQELTFLYAPGIRAWQLYYKGEFNHLTRDYDLVLKGRLGSPALSNFFGYGNHTRFDNTKSPRFYQTRYNFSELEALVRQRRFDILHIMIGPYFSSYNSRYAENKDNILARPEQVKLDSSDIFSKKAWLGGKLKLQIDNRNNEFFPTRGVYWINEIRVLKGIKKGSDTYSSFISEMTIHASMADPANLVAILKIGGGRILSKNYEYFQAMTLGAEKGLAGFRKNRYAGRSCFYSSLELKIKLMDVNSYILPGQFGFTVFGNIGRVQAYNDSRKWHIAYGLGFYYLPFNLFAITGSLGFSQNEKMLAFSIGSKFNLTY